MVRSLAGLSWPDLVAAFRASTPGARSKIILAIDKADADDREAAVPLAELNATSPATSEQLMRTTVEAEAGLASTALSSTTPAATAPA